MQRAAAGAAGGSARGAARPARRRASGCDCPGEATGSLRPERVQGRVSAALAREPRRDAAPLRSGPHAANERQVPPAVMSHHRWHRPTVRCGANTRLHPITRRAAQCRVLVRVAPPSRSHPSRPSRAPSRLQQPSPRARGGHARACPPMHSPLQLCTSAAQRLRPALTCACPAPSSCAARACRGTAPSPPGQTR